MKITGSRYFLSNLYSHFSRSIRLSRLLISNPTREKATKCYSYGSSVFTPFKEISVKGRYVYLEFSCIFQGIDHPSKSTWLSGLLVRTRTRRTSRRGVRATTDKNVPTRFFLSPFLTLSPFTVRSPLPSLRLYPRRIWNGRSTRDMRDCRGDECDCRDGTRRDETSRAEPCGRYPGKTPRDDKTAGMRSDLMRRVDTVFLLSFVGRGTAFSNLAELRTVISDLFSNSILS